jgi:cytochrome c biogenesis protein
MPTVNQPNTTQQIEATEVSLFALIWDFLGNLKFAAVLLLLYTVISLLGTFIPQGEPTQAYVQAYGPRWGKLLDATGFTTLYTTPWYIAIICLIAVSTLVCTIKRYAITVRRGDIHRGEFGPERVKLMRANQSVTMSGTVESAAERIAEALRKMGYGPRIDRYGKHTCIVGDKGRIGNWGMFILHSSLLVIAIGAIVSTFVGYTGYDMMIPQGESVSEITKTNMREAVPSIDPQSNEVTWDFKQKTLNLPFAIKLERFRVGVDKNGFPTSYESDLQIVDKGKTVKKATVSMNRPVRYRGVRFFQSTFDLTGITIKVVDPSGKESLTVLPVTRAMSMSGTGYELQEQKPIPIRAGDRMLVLMPYEMVPNYDPKVKGAYPTRGDAPANPAVMLLAQPMGEMGRSMPEQLGWVSKDRAVKIEGSTVSIGDVQYNTGLGVAKSPGLPIVYLGFTAFILGMVLAFYVAHRVVRVCAWDEKGKTMAAMGGTARFGDATFEREFADLESTAQA